MSNRRKKKTNSKNINIDFDFKLFNPNFYHCISNLKDDTLRYCFYYGGSSSAKTYSLVQAITISTLLDGNNTIIFRKTSNSIKKTIKNDFIAVINQLKLNKLFNIQDFRIVCNVNNAEIAFSGLDDTEKIKGLSGYQRIMIDEISNLEANDFKQVRKRMRGVHNQKLLATFNPISEDHWLKQEIFDKLSNIQTLPNTIDNNKLTEITEVQRSDNYIINKSTYLNNYYIVGSPDKTWGYVDINTINDFEKDKQYDFNFYNVYALGNWGKINQGGEFYNKFDNIKHIIQSDNDTINIDINKPLHISFDENVRPYMPMTISQIDNNNKTWIVKDEITAESPYNNINDLIKIFSNKYINNIKYPLNNKIIIYGDSTSRRADARVENGYNLYNMIYNGLTEAGFTNVELNVPASNPSVCKSGEFINRVLAGIYDNIELKIQKNCDKTIRDFNYLKQDKEGNILKEKGKADDGTVYEKYGHLSDSVRYAFIRYFSDDYNKFLNNNSMVESYTNNDIYGNGYVEYDSDFISF